MFFNLFSQLARSGAEVHVITNVSPLPGSSRVDELIMHGISVDRGFESERFSVVGDVRFFAKAIYLFFQLHRRIGFDIIHRSSGNFPAVGLVLSLLAKLSGCRAAMEFPPFPLRREDLKGLPQLVKGLPLWRRLACTLAFRLPVKLWSWGLDSITVSSEIGRSLLRDIGIEERKLFFIPPGVDFHVFKPQLKVGRPPHRIIYASSCYPWKGTLDLLEAFGIAVRRGFALELTYLFYTPRTQSPATRFFISQLEQKIAEIGLTRQVEIRDGPMEGIEQVIAQADIIACPIQVGVGTLDIPMSVLEGMACGLPVLATDVGGIPEAVIDGVNGYLVEPRAPGKLAEALVRIIEDPARMRKMGEESLRLAQRFDVEKSAALLLETYSALVGQRS